MPDCDTDPKSDLERLLLDPDLERLEQSTQRLNVFDALGVVRQELRHSDFLAFLLDPRAPHGLRSNFLRWFLMRSLARAPRSEVDLIEIDARSFANTRVEREWRNIDVLIVDSDASGDFVCLIENKLGSGEHDDQLARYLEIVRLEFPDAQVLPIFLSPEGDPPSHDDYVAIDYEMITSIIRGLLESEASVPVETSLILEHYNDMVERHVAGDSGIAKLCRQIYENHKRALDLIFEHRPDTQHEIADHLEALARADGFVMEQSSKSTVRFVPESWSNLPMTFADKSWLRSGRILLFEWANSSTELFLRLQIGPGPADVRQALFDAASSGAGFKFTGKLEPKWKYLFSKKVLSKKDLEKPLDEVTKKIDAFWRTWTAGPLLQMESVITALPWDKLTHRS